MASSSSIAASAPEMKFKGAFDGIAPSASTSASKRTQKPCYDVFINHRGPDVKYTIASTLYAILTGMSLSVFLDSQELEYGDFLPQTIEAAMASAFLHIVIFSKSYADSPWCLAELTFVHESGAKIIPIFYHVEPSDVRWIDQAKGMYVQAFKEHERKGRYSPEQLQEWKTALHNVSFYHGQIIQSNEDEMRLLKNIVSCVMREINNSVPLEVAKHPVGMKEIVEDFKVNTLRTDHGNHVQIIGIWGMGGSGKTTLAKELYNEMSSLMQRSSFVFNIRDAATKGLLHEKQKKLLNDLGIQGLTFDNTEDGKRSLSRGLRSVRVLIVLDDVDNIEQLDALLFTKDSFQKGSIIIVTARVYEVLQLWRISSIHKMRSLDPLYAKQLFCWHAFLKSYPPDAFKELVEKFLIESNGLPLSLKVFGAQLCGESRKEYWESQLNKILRILPDDIMQRLKISYDTLDDEEKEMFLDIACFFIGEESSLAVEVWNGLGCNGLHSWGRLLHKCLVELDNDNHIRMHDHLRDLGRNISHKQLPYRLWSPQQIVNTHKQEEKRTAIQGIITTSNQMAWSNFSGGENTINVLLPFMAKAYGKTDDFRVCCSRGKLMVNTNGRIWTPVASLVGLKYLVISKDLFNQVLDEVSKEQLWLRWFKRFLNQTLDEVSKELILGEISRELVWLRWFEIPHRSLTSELSLQKLRVLELFEVLDEEMCGGEHHLEELWGETDGEVPLQLRQLLISQCHKFQGFPKSIGHLNHLKKIVIVKSRKLTSLPDEFCLLQSLEHLVLYKCSNLSSLPRNFGYLRNLRHLCLVYCSGLKRLPISFKNLILLEHLNLEGCYPLTFSSEDLNFLEKIKKLEFLNLAFCEKVEELPRHITNQASLRELYIRCHSLRELPENIGKLRRLREMKISDVLLTSLPSSLGDLSSLTGLEIRDCPELESLPESLGDLFSLTNLKIEKCPKLKSVPKSIRQLNNLQELTISFCSISELDFGAASLSFGLSNLKKIDLKWTEVCRISFSEDCCPRLETLLVSNNHQLKEIEALPRTLLSIRLENCEMLKSIPSFADLTCLTEFYLREDCYGIQKIEGLENCTRLEALIVDSFWEVPGIESLECMQNLKWLGLKANKRSVIERCIQRIQKWPDELRICSRAVPEAASLVDSLLPPNLVIDTYFSFPEKLGRAVWPVKITSTSDASIFCFVLNCVSAEIVLETGYNHRAGYCSVKVGKGRWAFLGVVTEYSNKNGYITFDAKFKEEHGTVEIGLVVRGRDQTPVEAFRSLLPLLQS